jgi:phosphoadenosine phosphosulfate reductase
MEKLEEYRKEIEGLNLLELLTWASMTFGTEGLALASSLGVEDQLLTAKLLEAQPKSRVFTLDTGRQFPESYAVMQNTMAKYKFNYEIGFPEPEAIQELVNDKGPDLFYYSVENRKACCGVRKITPLKKILATAHCWITGLRASQSITRTDMHILEWDSGFGLYKLNPLILWSEEEVWNLVKEEKVPYNALHDKGFPSIGCAPCTRAVEPGEDIRAGRWWWEMPDSKECGLHIDENGNAVRVKK